MAASRWSFKVVRVQGCLSGLAFKPSEKKNIYIYIGVPYKPNKENKNVPINQPSYPPDARIRGCSLMGGGGETSEASKPLKDE